MKCFTCLRQASGDSLLAFGLLLVWSEQVGDGSGSDPGGTSSHLAQISLSVVIWVGRFEHHTARSDTPCREKPRSGLPAWEELLAVDVRALLVWCCDAVCLVSVSAMTVVVLAFWLRTLCHECLSRCVKADIWGGGLAVSPGKPLVPHWEERPGAAHSRRDQMCVTGRR